MSVHSGERAASPTKAAILPFPRVRNLGFVLKYAIRMAELPPGTAERHLAHRVEVQRQTMIRRGIAAYLIENETKALERAIRAVMWRLVSPPSEGIVR